MLNRRLLLFVILLLSGAGAVSAQATAAAVAAIRAEYQRIWSGRASYKARTLDLEGESSDGGSGTAYYEGQQLRLLVAVHYWETGKAEARYFYKNGQLLFALNSLHRYNRPYYYTEKIARESGDTEAFDPKKSEITESRYYFQNGKLIRWLDHTGKQQPVAASKNEEYRELLAAEARVRAELKK